VQAQGVDALEAFADESMLTDAGMKELQELRDAGGTTSNNLTSSACPRFGSL